MIQTENAVLKQYERLVSNVNSTDKLQEYLEDSDWTLLVSCRDSLAGQDLSPAEQQALADLDRKLNTHFNAELLEAYAESELPVAEWWG